ncbi:MAG: sugar phosphate isomerase/epimerase [Planctomycetaceae bacterium]|nr:sugar phosphate isomerase/epimerase [Planctomycetaceae bacterium]
MRRPQIALAARCLQLPVQKVFRPAHEYGADGLQFDGVRELQPAELSGSGRRQLLLTLAERNLVISSLLVEPDRPLWDERDLDRRIDTLKQTMQFAWDLQSRIVVTRMGRLPEEDGPREVLEAVLNDLAAHGNRCGVMLALTPARDPVDDVLALMRKITAGPMGLSFDPASIALSGQDVEAAWRALYSQVVHIQARDAIRDIDGQGIEVPVGRGEVGWDELLPLIREAEYHGWFTVDRTTGDDRPGDAARAIQFLRTVLEE